MNENNFENWIPQDPTDVELWYDVLKDETFATKFVPLPFEVAESLVRYQESEEMMNDDDRNAIEKLIEQMTQKMNEFDDETSAFVRLSTLSPKDATLTYYEKLMDLLKKTN